MNIENRRVRKTLPDLGGELNRNRSLITKMSYSTGGTELWAIVHVHPAQHLSPS
jgi:hypothetical protein